MTAMRKYLLALALACLSLISCSCQELGGDGIYHHYNPQEWDVVSPQNSPCVTERGFFGRNAKFDQRIFYRYELYLNEGEYVTDATSAAGEGELDGLQGVFSAIETGIADALLGSDVFDSVCTGEVARGPFLSDGNRQLLGSEKRQMRAVGISSKPEDQILEGRKSKSAAYIADCSLFMKT
jgi:hypothetical protein